MAKPFVHSVLCTVDASYEGLNGGWNDLNDPLATIADCCAETLEHLSISLGMFNGGGIGLEQRVLSGVSLIRFQQLQTLAVQYGDHEVVLRAGLLPILSKFGWTMMCSRIRRYDPDNDTDDELTSPRFVLRSSSLVTMYINTFKGENICFKEVDCPKLELISTHHHSTCDVILDGPVNTAPGFQMHAGEHWNMLNENLSDTEKFSWHNEFPFLRREKQQCFQQELVMIRGSRRNYTSRYVPTINLALPDVPLTLIDRNR